MSCHSWVQRATGLENWTAVEDGPGRVKKGLKEGGGRQRIYASRSGGSSCWKGRVDVRAVCRGRVEQAQSLGQTRQCRCSLHRAVEVWVVSRESSNRDCKGERQDGRSTLHDGECSRFAKRFRLHRASHRGEVQPSAVRAGDRIARGRAMAYQARRQEGSAAQRLGAL
jgi:hypothetical protein